MDTVDGATFWETRYRSGTTPWDLGGPTPAFAQLLAESAAPTPGRLLVPGCGRGYDAVLFARHGFSVVGVDLAPTALAHAARLARDAGVTCTVVEVDLFDLAGRYPGAFDYVLEYTCFCAIDPVRRREYVQVLADCLRPGGWLLGLFFPVLPPGYPRDGPPFAVADAEIRALFADRFAIEHLAPTPHTIKPRRGRELLARFRRR